MFTHRREATFKGRNPKMAWSKSEVSLRIGPPKRTHERDGTCIVTADVGGKPIWFSSKDACLAESAEAFASALLVPMAARGGSLNVEAALDSVWLEGTKALQQQLRNWWGFPGINVIAPLASRLADQQFIYSAQCFTGGVDSYYELITASPRPNVLVFVHGYDVSRSDKARLEAFLPGFYQTAEAFGARPVLITTNLREHPVVRKSSWEKGHGGALAAAAHLLSGMINELTIPSSYPYHDSKPWGSHWEIDPLWSTSSVRICHGDATHRRNGKVLAIATNDLVRRHLRVCHENNSVAGNCSRCEKCIRTMIAFANVGMLDSCEAFDRDVPLARRVDRLPRVPAHLISVIEELRRDIADQNLARAVDKLIDRSRTQQSPHRRRWAKWHERVLRNFS